MVTFDIENVRQVFLQSESSRASVNFGCEFRRQFRGGGLFLLTGGAFLLTVKLLCLQSLKALIRRTYPL